MALKRMVSLGLLPLFVASCGADGPDPALHAGRLEIAYADMLARAQTINDAASARLAIPEIRKIYDGILDDRKAIMAYPEAKATEELKKRVKGLQEKMAQIMIHRIRLAPAVQKIFDEGLKDVNFAVQLLEPKEK